MPKSLKDIIGPRSGRNVSKDELEILGDLKVDKKEDPAGNKDDIFNASKVPSEATLQKADPGMRHGYRSLKAAGKAYEETVIEQKKKKTLPPEDDRNVNGKDYGYSAGAKGGNGLANEENLPQKTCNNTSEGTGCPVHGMKECMSEKKNIIKEKGIKEEVEEIDEVSSKLLNRAMHAAVKKAGWLMPGDKGKGDKAWNRAKKFQKAGLAKQAKEKSERLKSSQKNEEVEQVDELSIDTLKSYKEKQLFSKDKSPKQSFNRLVGNARASRRIAAKEKTNENVEIDEVLKKSTPTDKWISDFVHSDNPKFAGKSKKERIQMALGAKYAKMREDVDYEGEMAKTQLKALAAKATSLASMMSDNQQLEAWVQSKLTNAKHDIDAVHDYLTYGEPTKEDAPNDALMTFPGMNIDTALGRV